jgi:hypothetical protein
MPTCDNQSHCPVGYKVDKNGCDTCECDYSALDVHDITEMLLKVALNTIKKSENKKFLNIFKLQFNQIFCMKAVYMMKYVYRGRQFYWRRKAEYLGKNHRSVASH